MPSARNATSRTAAAKTTRRSRSGGIGKAWIVYRDAAPEPLYSLLFLFPLVIAYEAGALMLRPTPWPENRLVAQGVIQAVFGWFGAEIPWLSGAAILLLLTLLAWHVMSGKNWQVRGWVPLGMALESVVLTIPLFVNDRLGRLGAGFSAFGVTSFDGLKSQLVLAVGAALYEELVFRMALLMLLMVVLVHVLKVQRTIAIAAAICIGALFFALCHVQPVGAEPFHLPRFAIRFAAGAYLSLVFLMRGLGVATGCHAAFNIAVLVGIGG